MEMGGDRTCLIREEPDGDGRRQSLANLSGAWKEAESDGGGQNLMEMGGDRSGRSLMEMGGTWMAIGKDRAWWIRVEPDGEGWSLMEMGGASHQALCLGSWSFRPSFPSLNLDLAWSIP